MHNNDISILFSSAIKSIKFAASISLFSIIVLIIVIISIDNKYESITTLHPTEKESNLATMANRYSGLAAIAGVSLPGTDEISNSEVAIEILKSEDFFLSLYQKNNFLPDLIAYDSYNAITKQSSYKEKIFDTKSNKWIRKVSYPQEKIPSIREAYKKFHKHHFQINKDEKTGIINLSVKHESPHIAQNWLNHIVYNINKYMQDSEVERAQKSLNFIKEQMNNTQNNQLLEVLASMAEAKIQTVMLSEVSDEFVFRIIQKPTISNYKESPNRTYLVIFFTFLILFIVTSFMFFMAYLNKKILLNFMPPKLQVKDI